MRGPAALAVALAATGCSVLTSLDGLKGGPGPNDAGADAPGADAASDASTDGASDADAGPALLTCAASGPKIIATDLTFDRKLFVHRLPGDTYRVAVERTAPPAFYDVAGNLGPGTPVSVALPAPTYGRVLSYEGGFVSIAYDQTQLKAVLIEDASKTSVGPTVIPMSPQPTTVSDMSFAIAAIDPAQKTFFVAVSLRDGVATEWSLYAGKQTLAGGTSPTTLKKIGTSADRPGWDSGVVLLDRAGLRAALLTEPSSAVGDLVATTVDYDGNKLGSRTVVGAGKGHLLASYSAPVGGATNMLGFIEGDLNDGSVPLGIRFAQLPDNAISTFDEKSLAPLFPMDTSEVAIDHAGFNWQTFSNLPPQLLVAARSLTTKGINFFWMSGATVRARAGGANALLPSEDVVGASATFRDAPTQLLAQPALAWIDQAHNVKMVEASCLKQ